MTNNTPGAAWDRSFESIVENSMPKAAKLKFEILQPLVDRGLTTKQMVYETGCSQRMVNRRLKAFGLRKKRIADAGGRANYVVAPGRGDSERRADLKSARRRWTFGEAGCVTSVGARTRP